MKSSTTSGGTLAVISPLEFTCPNCDTHYSLWDDGKGPISPQKYKKLEETIAKQYKIGTCKACKRKDPKVPTTFEMDGLLTKEDIKNRFKVMRQCRSCKKWTQMHIDKTVPCSNCGSENYDAQSTKSLRTFNPVNDNKRKPK